VLYLKIGKLLFVLVRNLQGKEGLMAKTNILITGNVRKPVWTLAAVLEENGYHVTVAAGIQAKPEDKSWTKNYAELSPDFTELAMIYRAGNFQAVVYMFSYTSEACDVDGENSVFGHALDGLKKNLEMMDLFQEVGRLILVTDQRMFGKDQEMDELTRPVPDTYAGKMNRLAEAEFIMKKREGTRFDKLLVRTTHLYGPGEKEGILGCFTVSGDNVKLAGSLNREVDLLSFEDFGRFLAEAAAQTINGTVHVYHGKPVSPELLLQAIQKKGKNLVFTEQYKSKATLTGDVAYRRFGWVPADHFLSDLESEGKLLKRKKTFADLQQWIREKLGKLAAPLETLIGAAIMQLLLRVTETYTLFRIVDVRLLFVVIVGSIHGAVWGCIAGLIAYLSYCSAYLMQGGGLWDLLLNMDNWLPLVLYLLAGEVTGYLRTNSLNRIRELEGELANKESELDFLRKLHQSTCDQRDMLKEQVIKSQDSYGKVYNMVNELDLLNPDEVSFKAIHILESVLHCDSITIYYREGGGRYLRKIAESSNLKMENIPYSLNLEEYPDVLEALNKGETYINKTLESGMPAYAISQPMSEELSLVVFLWHVEYRQYSKYYQNLLAITTSLISHSMRKAVEFKKNLDRYIPGTILLKHDEFISAWQVRRQMRLENMGIYVLFQISPALPDIVLSERLKKCIRNLDVAGKTNDGNRYLLMMQADERFVPMLLKRLESNGIAATAIDDSDLNIYL